MNIKRSEVGRRMSQIVVHDNTIYLAGQICNDPSGSVGQQTREMLSSIDRLLASVGSDKSKLLSVTIWLSDMADFEEMNAVWDQWIDPENPPARACVQSVLAKPEWKVEAMVVAAL